MAYFFVINSLDNPQNITFLTYQQLFHNKDHRFPITTFIINSILKYFDLIFYY